MDHADIDELSALALDAADGRDSLREHVTTCPECSDLLDSLIAVRRLAGAEPLVAAPPGLRQRVLQEALSDPAVGRPAPVAVPARNRRGIPAWAAGLAAALTLVAGIGLGRLSDGGSEPTVEPDPGTVVAAADLTALDSDAPRGVASAVRTDDTVTLRVRASDLGGASGVHEVWLINVDGERMVAIGLLAAGDDGEFQVPLGLIEEGYRIVDISVEPDDGDPRHSGVSLARGELA